MTKTKKISVTMAVILAFIMLAGIISMKRIIPGVTIPGHFVIMPFIILMVSVFFELKFQIPIFVFVFSATVLGGIYIGISIPPYWSLIPSAIPGGITLLVTMVTMSAPKEKKVYILTTNDDNLSYDLQPKMNCDHQRITLILVYLYSKDTTEDNLKRFEKKMREISIHFNRVFNIYQMNIEENPKTVAENFVEEPFSVIIFKDREWKKTLMGEKDKDEYIREIRSLIR